ncbi:MAG: GNAT family N-acetyltransferase [Anaerolineae bacterium]|nr:GNAT family N-acetyltransferase [Anaerolineae bacterium]
MNIRQASPDEAGILTELMRRSKAYWGYSTEFMELARDTLQITAEQIITRQVYVLEDEGQIIGFCHFYQRPDDVYLEDLFIEPNMIGRGYGKILFDYVTQFARAKGMDSIVFEADPNAEPFYHKLGATTTGHRPSPIFEGRFIPQMHCRLKP